MRLKLLIPILTIFAVTSVIMSACQKDDTNDAPKQANICPEVAMGNYDEVGIIIDDYLKKQVSHDSNENLDQLNNYFEDCGCIESAVMNDSKLAVSSQKEIKIRFTVNNDTISKLLDLIQLENGQLEFRRLTDQ